MYVMGTSSGGGSSSTTAPSTAVSPAGDVDYYPIHLTAPRTDLLIQMRGGRVEPELLVDIKHIPEMTSIVAANGYLFLNSGYGLMGGERRPVLAPLHELRHPLVQRGFQCADLLECVL